MKEIGFNALPVTMQRKTHVEYAYNGKNGDIKSDHVIKDLIKDLPEKLEHPLAVLCLSESRPGRVVALLEMDKPNTGNKVVVPVEVDGFGRQNNIRIDSNALTSVYGRKNALVQLKEAIENDSADDCRLFYWNKNEAVSLLQRAGLQLPSGLPQDGSVHSIRENGSKVNMKFENETESQQFKRWFGDWKKESEPGKQGCECRRHTKSGSFCESARSGGIYFFGRESKQCGNVGFAGRRRADTGLFKY